MLQGLRLSRGAHPIARRSQRISVSHHHRRQQRLVLLLPGSTLLCVPPLLPRAPATGSIWVSCHRRGVAAQRSANRQVERELAQAGQAQLPGELRAVSTVCRQLLRLPTVRGWHRLHGRFGYFCT